MGLTMGAVGKIYGLKIKGEDTKTRATFRIGVRKRWVSEEDKEDGNTFTFIPCAAFGATAQFIERYFEDGKPIHILDMEYQTYRSKDAETEYDDSHIFRVNQVAFVPDSGEGSNDNGGGRSRRSNRDDDRDSGRGGRSGRRGRSSRREESEASNDYDPSDDLPF